MTRAVVGSTVDLGDRIADRVDRHELDVLVDRRCRSWMSDVRPRRDAHGSMTDAGPEHLDLGRVRRSSSRARGPRAATPRSTSTGTVRVGELVEIDGHHLGLEADDRDAWIDRVATLDAARCAGRRRPRRRPGRRTPRSRGDRPDARRREVADRRSRARRRRAGTCPSGWFDGVDRDDPVERRCVLCDSTSPPYRRVASPIAASLRGQLWTMTPMTRVTAAPVRPRWWSVSRAERQPERAAAAAVVRIEQVADRAGELGLVEVAHDARRARPG